MVEVYKKLAKNTHIKNILIILCVCVYWILVLQPLWVINYTQYSNKDNVLEKYSFGEITSENSLIQQINVEEDYHVDNISIFLATYMRMNTNTNSAKIFINKKCVFNHAIQSENVEDNSFYRIDNVNLEFKKNDEIYFVLESQDGISGNAITAWITTDINNGIIYRYNSKEGSFEPLDGKLIMTIGGKVSTLRYISEKYLGISPTMATVLFIVLTALIICLLYQFLNLKEEEGV